MSSDHLTPTEQSEPHELFELAYASRSVELFDEEELNNILATARAFNSLHGITGMLLYRSMSFLQVLEGPESEVRSLFARIERDPRHFRIRKLVDRPAKARRFPTWSMGFHVLDTAEEHPRGFTDFLDRHEASDDPVVDLTDGDEVVELLHIFRSQA